MKRDSGPIFELAQYREFLLAKRSELLVEMGSKIPRLSDSGWLAEDDQAQALHDQFISLEVQQRCYRTLKEIDAALDRLATGDYGVCLNWGESINPRRLAAIPWAGHCIRCQETMSQHVEELDGRAA
jgi:RNA polymerase-binding transcription factor